MPKIDITDDQVNACATNEVQAELLKRIKTFLDTQYDELKVAQTELDKAKQDITSLQGKK